MSKDKGVKNIKKPPAEKIPGKVKSVSAYKSESKSGSGVQSFQKAMSSNSDSKKGGDKKS